MATKWTSNSLDDGDISEPQRPLGDEFVVLLLYGKNPFGDKIYSYLKVTLSNLQKLKAAIHLGQGFNPSDFGEVVAAGRDEPTDAVRLEIASMYQVMDAHAIPKPISAAPAQKKAWDEF